MQKKWNTQSTKMIYINPYVTLESEEEHIELVKVSLEAAVEVVMKNKIVHAPSVGLILKAKEYIHSHL